MKVMLLFPPQFLPTHPYLSLPALTAYLRGAGHEVVQWDLNVEVYDWHLSPEQLRFEHARVEARMLELETRGLASFEDQQHYRALSEVHLMAPSLIERIEEAKAVFRGPEFYQPARFNWAYELVSRALKLISASYYPTQFKLKDFTTDYYFAFRSSSEILKAARDDHHNVFMRAFEHLALPRLEAERPELVGFSVASTTQMIPTLTLARLIKERWPETHLVVGGTGISPLSDRLAHAPDLFDYVDGFVMYDGERSLEVLCEELAGERRFERVPNLVYRTAQGVQVNDFAFEKTNLMPVPDYDGITWERYFEPERVISIQTSRGCYWNKCTFCRRPGGLYPVDHSYSPRLTDPIIQDMTTLEAKYGSGLFNIVDEAAAPTMLTRMASAISEGGHSFRWYAWTRLEKAFSRDNIITMGRGGARKLMFGQESGNERILSLMQKFVSKDMARSIYAWCREAGISVHTWLMTGFPSETLEEAHESRDFILENLPSIDSVGYTIDVGRFVLMKDTHVDKDPDTYGVLKIHHPEHDLAMSFDHVVERGLSLEEAERLAVEIRREILSKLKLDLGYIRDEQVFSFLYACHYEGREDELEALLATKDPGSDIEQLIPKRSQDLTMATLPFDITRIPEQGEQGEPAPLESTHFAYGGRHVVAISAAGKMFLDRCDGTRTAGDILDQFVGSYPLPLAGKAREQAKAFLQSLYEGGLITWSSNERIPAR